METGSSVIHQSVRPKRHRPITVPNTCKHLHLHRATIFYDPQLSFDGIDCGSLCIVCVYVRTYLRRLCAGGPHRHGFYFYFYFFAYSSCSSHAETVVDRVTAKYCIISRSFVPRLAHTHTHTIKPRVLQLVISNITSLLLRKGSKNSRSIGFRRAEVSVRVTRYGPPIESHCKSTAYKYALSFKSFLLATVFRVRYTLIWQTRARAFHNPQSLYSNFGSKSSVNFNRDKRTLRSVSNRNRLVFAVRPLLRLAWPTVKTTKRIVDFWMVGNQNTARVTDCHDSCAKSTVKKYPNSFVRISRWPGEVQSSRRSGQ